MKSFLPYDVMDTFHEIQSMAEESVKEGLHAGLTRETYTQVLKDLDVLYGAPYAARIARSMVQEMVDEDLLETEDEKELARDLLKETEEGGS
jgi:hypothetical protein